MQDGGLVLGESRGAHLEGGFAVLRQHIDSQEAQGLHHRYAVLTGPRGPPEQRRGCTAVGPLQLDARLRTIHVPQHSLPAPIPIEDHHVEAHHAALQPEQHIHVDIADELLPQCR